MDDRFITMIELSTGDMVTGRYRYEKYARDVIFKSAGKCSLFRIKESTCGVEVLEKMEIDG